MTDNDGTPKVEVGTGAPPEDPPESMAVAPRAPEPPPPLSRVDAIGGMLRPVAEPAQIMEAQEATREFIEKALKPKRDYDTIPGTKKPTLLKPGAERTAAAFGCHARFTIMEQEVDHDRPNEYVKRDRKWGQAQGEKIWTETPGNSQGLYRYVVSCELVHRASNFVVGSGLGSCSTMESKYIDRPRDLENTVLKMAKKRAFIDAVLTTFGLSEQFTQDTEDMPSEHFQKGGGKTQGFSLDGPAMGKNNKGETWRQVCERDPEFILWAIGKKKGEGIDRLSPADRKVLSDELDRLAGSIPQDAEENTDQSQPDAPDPPSAVFVQMTTEANATLAGCQALAKVHPKLPDDMDEWGEDDYQVAVGAFLTAADRGGVTYVLDRALKKLNATQPEPAPPEEPTPKAGGAISPEMEADAVTTMAKCDAKGMDTQPWFDVFRAASERGDAKAYELHLDLLKQAYLVKMANGKDTAPTDPQGAMGI